MTLALNGRTARLRLDQARCERGGGARLVCAWDEQVAGRREQETAKGQEAGKEQEEGKGQEEGKERGEGKG